MSAITTTMLAKAQTAIAKTYATPNFSNHPYLDMAIRLGKVEEVVAATVNVPFINAAESLQTVAAFSQWTTATSDNLKAFQVILWDSITTPAKFDERHLGTSSESKLQHMATQVNLAFAQFGSKLNYSIFNDANWDGSAYNKPMAGLKELLKATSTYTNGNPYGVLRSAYTNFMHMYSVAASANLSANCTTFTASNSGFMDLLMEAKTKATVRGGSKFVCYVDSLTYGYLYKFVASLGGLSYNNGGIPSWVPQNGTVNDMPVGSIGYETIMYNGILFIPTDGIDTTVTNCYLIAYESHGQPNVVWYYIKNPNGSYKTKFAPVYLTDWNKTDRSWTWEAAVSTQSSIVLIDTSICATIKHTGVYA